MQSELDLVYPIYLDAAMLASLLATVEPGANGSEDGNALNTEQIWSMLSGATNGFQQKYAESVLFQRLRQQWQNSKSVTELESVQNLAEIKPGGLVEVKGQLQRSPLFSTLEAFLRLMSISGVDLDNPPAPVTPPVNTLRRMTVQPPTPEVNLEEANFFRMFQDLRNELASAKVQDLVMYPTGAELSVLVTLPVARLREDSFETLLSGDFRVIGKVTQVQEQGQTINLHQRSSFSYIHNELLETSFADLKDIPWINLQPPASFLEGPVVQILPLAIFA